ncbi:ESF1 homolog [Symsagittifera roscoffensis]|uniref:ESF1 homolog n=1 Tax=Symsagittifera roscoffensis TaxID=84072 RepID=UPI00307B152E
MESDKFQALKRDPRFRSKTQKNPEEKIEIDERFSKIVDHEDFKRRDIVQLKIEDGHDSEQQIPAEFRRVVPGVYDPARGIGLEESSSESSESESENEADAQNVNNLLHNWNFNDENVAKASSSDALSSTLALCNFDADHLSAQDIFMMLQSFLSLGGKIKSVKVYISDFGKEKLAEEAIEGPISLKVTEPSEHSNEISDEKNAAEKIRLYQAQRLRYFFAIISCSDSDTAAQLYEACDGLEFESSATFVDLRFVPDSENLDDNKLKDEFYPGADLAKYAPNLYTNKSMSHQKAEMTWDGDDRKRKEVLNKKVIKDEELDDYNAFLASSSSEEETDEQNAHGSLAKKRALLLGEDVAENRVEKVVQGSKHEKSVTIQLSAEEVQKLKTESKSRSDQSESEEIEEESDGFEEAANSDDDGDNVVSERRNTQNDLQLLLADVEDTDHKHFDYNKIVKVEKMSEKSRKRRNKEVDSFRIDTADCRFQALFENAEFAIDPSDPKFKATAAMKEIVSKRAECRGNKSRENYETERNKTPIGSEATTTENDQPAKHKLSSLIQSLKNKSKAQKVATDKRRK